MAEQAAVNCEVVGSSPTGAAIYCRMDDWVSRCRSERWRGWFDPNSGIHLLLCGVIGNISRFEREESWFKPRQGSQFQFIYAPVAQLAEAAVSNTV